MLSIAVPHGHCQIPLLFLCNSSATASTNGIIRRSSNSSSARKTSLSVVSAGYKRIAMETSGAYQLLDESTGEKFIVWGGSDDAPDSPLPSEEVLTWKPPRRQEEEKSAGEEVFDTTGVEVTLPLSESLMKPMADSGTSMRSFGRLKVPQLKALIKKSSRSTTQNIHVKKKVSVTDTPLDEIEYMKSEPDPPRRKASSLLLRQKESVDDMTTDEEVQATKPSRTVLKQDRDREVHISGRRVGSSLRGWTSAPSVRETAIPHPKLNKRMSADGGFFSRRSFKDLGCSNYMIESLRSLLFLRPSHIQAMAYAPVLEGKSCIIADQSGSGKTLAYLVPIVQRMRQEELEGLSKSSAKCPRVVILVPTAELASQVLSNCRSISKNGVPFRSMVATGGFKQKTQLDSLKQELDVLIATPGRFIFLLQEGFVKLDNLKCVVLDEVDILYGDEGFEQVLQRLISSAPMEAQYLFVTATLPIDIYNKVVQVFPDCEVTMGPGIHRTSSGLEEVLVDCSGDDRGEKNPDTAFLNKKTALLRLVEESPVSKTIVFCNKIETCRKVENALNRFDRQGFRIKVLPFHAALAQEIRLANMKEFLKSQTKDSMFLICTDRASRGIDFSNVDHVVLFDFPRDPSEYVRRVGRTARGAGGKGKAYVFVVGKQVSFAKRIMDRNQKGHPLHDVPSAYELESSVL